jgi:hypothetical protein
MNIDDPFVRYSVTTLYHFTDRRNLPRIRDLGGLYSLVKLTQMQVVVPNPGGNEWSHDADKIKGVDGYVHLCFKPNHPMEYRAREEGRIGESIFLQIHPVVLEWADVKFTADVSNKAGVPIHTIDEAKQLIDFEVLYTRTDWRNPAIQQRLQQAEKSEILVPNHIPIEFIRNIPNG